MNEVQIYEGVLGVAQQESKLIEVFTAPERIKKVFTFAPAYIQDWEDEKKEQFLKKTMMVIAHDEKLAPCFKTDAGKISIMDAVQKCCSTGLEIGGKHAYLVPTDGKARFSIKASGYYALLAGGDRPIFSDLRWSLVYEKDECKIDAGTGEVTHVIGVSEDRGKCLGCWVQIVKKAGGKDAKFFPMKKINQWKAASKAQAYVWDKWPDEMAEQSSIRHACDKYEQARDLLVNAIYNDDGQPTEEKTNTEIINDELSGDEELIPESEKKEDNDNF